MPKTLAPLFKQYQVELRAIPHLQEGAQFSLLVPPKKVKDDPSKVLVRDKYGQRRAVLLISPKSFPNTVAEGMQLTLDAKRSLGSPLGEVVMTPLAQGRREGRTFAILPYQEPLQSGRFAWFKQRRAITPPLMQWLLESTRHTARLPSPLEFQTNFLTPLTHLQNLKGVSSRLKRSAENCLERHEQGQWKPRLVLMHNDLWKDNILLKNNRYGFVIIDWPGSRVNGYGIYDVIRLAQSLSLSKTHFSLAIRTHCEALSCDSRDASSHLISGLAELSTRLGAFPLDQFVALAEGCLDSLERLNLR